MKEEEYKGITPLVSDMVDTLTDSEIRVIAGAIDAMISQGERIFNLTIGDFNPEIFPIPQEFCEYVYKEYKNGKTNYPPLQGEPPIRKVLSAYIKKREKNAKKTEILRNWLKSLVPLTAIGSIKEK